MILPACLGPALGSPHSCECLKHLSYMVSRRPIALYVTQTPFGNFYLHISTISWSLLTDRGHRCGWEHRLIVGTDTAQICFGPQCIAKRSFLNLHISMALTQNYSVRTISTDGNTGVHVNIRTGRQANIVKSWRKLKKLKYTTPKTSKFFTGLEHLSGQKQTWLQSLNFFQKFLLLTLKR